MKFSKISPSSKAPMLHWNCLPHTLNNAVLDGYRTEGYKWDGLDWKSPVLKNHLRMDVGMWFSQSIRQNTECMMYLFTQWRLIINITPRQSTNRQHPIQTKYQCWTYPPTWYLIIIDGILFDHPRIYKLKRFLITNILEI